MISIIIPTFKPKFLRDVLSILFYQETTTPYEVIVVENPKSTPEVERLVTSFGFRYYVSELGENNARHKGILESKYEIIAWLDDDMMPSVYWINQIASLAIANPNYSVCGGKVQLQFQQRQPRWLVGPFETMLAKVDWPTFYLRPLNHNEHIVSGNLFFKRSLYDAIGGLNLQVGLHGDDLIPNGEIEFVNKMKELGAIFYSPHLITYHQIDVNRCTLSFFRKRFYGQGYADGILYKKNHLGKSVNDIYHDMIQQSKLLDIDMIHCMREIICDESVTREFIKYYTICRTDYLLGLQNSILEDKLW